MKITKESALKHLNVLFEHGGLAKTSNGDFAIFSDMGWNAYSPDEAAETLAADLEGVDYIRSRICEFGHESAELPVPEVLLSDSGEDYAVFFDTETEYGEPQAWIYLKDGTSLEITHEEQGLTQAEQYFSVRHHCSEEDFENDVYHSSMGVIEQCSGDLTGISGMLERITAKAGIKEDARLCPVCGEPVKEIIRDEDDAICLHCTCGCETQIFSSRSISIEGPFATSNASVSRDASGISLNLEIKDEESGWTTVFAKGFHLDHPATEKDVRRYVAAGYPVADALYRRHNREAVEGEAEAMIETALATGTVHERASVADWNEIGPRAILSLVSVLYEKKLYQGLDDNRADREADEEVCEMTGLTLEQLGIVYETAGLDSAKNL